MDKRGKVPKSPPRGRHSPGAAALSGYIPAAIDAAGEDINPFRPSSRPASKGTMVLASVAATIADWLEPVTSRLVYAGRVAAVASLGVGDVLRRRLGTALVIAGAVISLGVGIVLGGAGSSVSASLPGVQNSSSTHSTTAKDWGELRTGISSGTTGSSSGKSQAPNTPASAGSVVGGGSSSLLAGPNTAGPLTSGTNPSSSGSHAQSPAATTPAPTGGSPTPTTPSGGSSGPGSGTKPTTTSTTSGGSPTTTRPTTTTTRPPTTTTTTQPPPPPTTTTQPPPPTTTTTQPCTPLQHFLNQC
ncbi:MAG TPA: hypothetical protein VG205_10210 [Acidimicrobiales bacterium]|nr:hypothetical protein [Acidimicrobiales bacterium]